MLGEFAAFLLRSLLPNLRDALLLEVRLCVTPLNFLQH
jgi:hypothetical protein